MSTTPITASSSCPAFATQTSYGDASMTVLFSGEANMDATSALGALLADVHEAALARSLREVVVDFRELEFMNSACFKKMVTWIGRVQDLAAGSRYRIRFVSNPRAHWQRRSLHALRCFAIDLVSVGP